MVMIVDVGRAVDVQNDVVLEHCGAKVWGQSRSTSMGCLVGCCLSTEHRIQGSGLAIGYLRSLLVRRCVDRRSKLSMLGALLQLLAHIAI